MVLGFEAVLVLVIGAEVEGAATAVGREVKAAGARTGGVLKPVAEDVVCFVAWVTKAPEVKEEGGRRAVGR